MAEVGGKTENYRKIGSIDIPEEALAINQLVDKGIVDPKDIQDATADQIDTLAGRVTRLLNVLANESREASQKVAKSYLGILDPEYKNPNRIALIAKAVLLALKLRHEFGSDVAGIVLVGSRVKKGVVPRRDSDLDVMVVGNIEAGQNDLLGRVRDSIKQNSKKLFDFPVSVNCLIPGKILRDDDPQIVANTYLPICEGCVPIIFDKNLRRSFFKAFGEQMKQPQRHQRSRTPFFLL